MGGSPVAEMLGSVRALSPGRSVSGRDGRPSGAYPLGIRFQVAALPVVGAGRRHKKESARSGQLNGRFTETTMQCWQDLEKTIPAVKDGDRVAVAEGAVVIAGESTDIIQPDPARRPVIRDGRPTFEVD